jgi:hypothetical protein
MLREITAVVPAICTPTFRHRIFPGLKRAILSIFYLYAHFGNTDANQSGFEEWALVNVAPIPEMDALFPIIGFFAVAFATQRLRPRRAQQVSTM